MKPRWNECKFPKIITVSSRVNTPTHSELRATLHRDRIEPSRPWRMIRLRVLEIPTSTSQGGHERACVKTWSTMLLTLRMNMAACSLTDHSFSYSAHKTGPGYNTFANDNPGARGMTGHHVANATLARQ